MCFNGVFLSNPLLPNFSISVRECFTYSGNIESFIQRACLQEMLFLKIRGVQSSHEVNFESVAFWLFAVFDVDVGYINI